MVPSFLLSPLPSLPPPPCLLASSTCPSACLALFACLFLAFLLLCFGFGLPVSLFLSFCHANASSGPRDWSATLENEVFLLLGLLQKNRPATALQQKAKILGSLDTYFSFTSLGGLGVCLVCVCVFGVCLCVCVCV